MVQRQPRLRPNKTQETHLQTWLWHLTGIWNWAIRKIEQDANDGIFYSQKALHNLLVEHGKKLGIPSHTLQSMLDTAWVAWQGCYKKLAKKPRLKSQRNKVTNMPFPDSPRLRRRRGASVTAPLPCKAPESTRIHVPGFLAAPSQFSTKTCSACGSLSGPTGRGRLGAGAGLLQTLGMEVRNMQRRQRWLR